MDLSRLTTSFQERLQESLTLLFRPSCCLCGRTALQVFCQDCCQGLQHCQRRKAWVKKINLVPLYGWGIYEGALKQSLAKLKYEGQRTVAKPLGQWLAQLWLEDCLKTRGLENTSLGKDLWVVPIPLHSEREQHRGYNQANLIAHSFCQVTGLPLRPQGLYRQQSTTAQYGLSRQARYQNLKDALTLGPDLHNLLRKRGTQSSAQPSIILIDDIFTTGATLKAATDCLQNAGLTVQSLLAVAVSERVDNPQGNT